MAAIDKLYVHTFQEYEEVKLWALVYYPKLLLWFYNISLTKEDFLRKRTLLDSEYYVPVMSTPFKVDRKLKWICPVPCVREYLHKQCGVNPKLEWLYKIFWRGKKYF